MMKMTPLETIKQAIAGVVGEDIGFVVEHPADERRGDYATNASLVLAKLEGVNPRDAAEKLVAGLMADERLGEVVDNKRIEIAGPGFINFWIKDNYLVRLLESMDNLGDKLGDSNFMSGKKVLVEYSSPNIAKRFSVGHLRSTIVGQALFNFYKHSGAVVTNDNHLGDWGTQFGMIIAAVEEDGVDISTMGVGQLEDLYVAFNKKVEDDPKVKERAREAFARLEHGEPKAREIWQKAWDVSMVEFREIYKKLGIPDFDHEYGESTYEKDMPEVIEEMKNKGVTVESEGAWIVKYLDKDGKEYMPPAMLLKSNGTTTYFTRDLATIKKRLSDPELKSDLYIYEVGAEQTLHFRQVFAAAELLGWAKKEQFVHVAHGRLSLPEGKMSTRKGNTIKLEDLLGRASEAASDEKIAIGAVKYNELKRAPGMDYVFKWEEALSMEGNSGPYLQYAYVRCRGVLEKVGNKFGTTENLNEDERKLLIGLLRFGDGEIVESAARNFAPQMVCSYLFDLAQRFNGFYDRNRVGGSENEGFRLLLVAVTGLVIKNGLALLGIETVEKM